MQEELDKLYETYKDFYYIYIGTNDYETQINDITDIIRDEYYDHYYGVSGSWMMPLAGVKSKLKTITLYDYNPLMLFVYNFIYFVISISEDRKKFIENLFSRSIKKDILSNEDVLEYLDQPIEEEIKNKLKEKLKNHQDNRVKIALSFMNKFYDNLIVGGDRIVYPSFFWDGKTFEFNSKKFRSQNKDVQIFTTFYYNIVYCFKHDKYYDNLKRILSETPISYKHIDINKISSNFFPNNDKILMYISNIDLKYPIYLNMHRDEFHKKIQNIVKQNDNEYIHILSTNTYLTKIKKQSINYKSNSNYKDISKKGYNKILKENKKKRYIGKKVEQEDIKLIEKIFDKEVSKNNKLNEIEETGYKHLYKKYKKKYLNLKNEKN